MVQSKTWKRDELIILLNIYHKLTFGQMHARQPVIIELANKLGRTANSVAMKLCNLASLDPALKLRGIRGLPGASKLDRVTWNEFHTHLDEVVPASEQEVRELFQAKEDEDLQIVPKVGVLLRKRLSSAMPTEVMVSVKIRRGQEYFREAVLNNFGGCCGVTQLDVRELLIASHILPWCSHPSERLNVQNGLCLSRLHDAAFDRGLIAFDDNLRLMLSSRLHCELDQQAVADCFGKYEGCVLGIPQDAVQPNIRFIAEHRDRIFQR